MTSLLKQRTCEVCGTPERWGMRLILQPKTKEDVTEGLTALIKAMERDAKEVPGENASHLVCVDELEPPLPGAIVPDAGEMAPNGEGGVRE